jgi:hypothetical protein
VGAGLFASIEEGAALVQPGARIEPASDPAWREAEHASWKRFVELAAQL